MNCVAYTGTHDNDTTQGLLSSLDDESLVLIADYLTGEKNSLEKAKKLLAGKTLTKLLVKLVLSSTAGIAVVPLQDVYALGTEARMNMPSTSGKNWSWRAEKGMIEGSKAEKAAAWLKNLTVLYAR